VQSPIASNDATILMAEDDDAIRALAAKVLRRAGYTVIAASDGEALLEQLQRLTLEKRPQLLLTDVVMPTLDGRRLAERIRVRFPAITVLFMSGFTADEAQFGGDASAPSGYLSKPFTPAALLSSVCGALRTHHA